MNVLLQKLRLIFHNTKSFSVLGHFAFYIMTKKIARISSKLYFDLFQRGGDRLIAVYAILKTSRNGEIKYYSYTAKNNKFISGYSLLRAKTNLTLHSIEKYVPTLIDMGLCFIDKNGDFVLVGNQKLKKQYNNKLLPIKIGVNLTDTAYNSLAVRVFSMEKTQKTQIEKKQTRSEIIAYGSKRLSKYYENKFGDNLEVNEKIVLSLQGFGDLKHSEDNKLRDIKSSGAYYKKKLREKGFIKTKREFKKIQKTTYSEYLQLKKYFYLSNKITYKNGWLVEELISSFETLSIKEKITVSEKTVDSAVILNEVSTVKEVYKRKPYLEFDMIDFWINGKNN